MQSNMDIRIKAQTAGVKLWQIADELGIADGNFSRKLRKELSEEEKAKIFSIIDSIAKNKNSAAAE